MFELGALRDSAEFYRRLAVTAAVLIVYRLGTQIPLPGINTETLAQLGAGTALERISIFALGITPFITMIIVAELAKVLFPRLARWEAAQPRNSDIFNRIVVGLSLLAAQLQALGLVYALEDVRGLVEAPGAAFRFAGIATLIGGTAIVIWFADLITRHGLGAGAWLLLVTPWLAEIPQWIAGVAGLARTGEISVTNPLLGLAIAAAVLAAIVGLIRAGASTPATVATCLWARLLGGFVWPWLTLLIGIILGGGSLAYVEYWTTPSLPLYLLQTVMLAGLVALFALLFLRSLRTRGEAAPPLPENLLAVAMGAIVFADMVATQLPVFVPLGGNLTVIAIVALALLARWWQPALADEARKEAARP